MPGPSAQPRAVDYYFTTMSPWAYIGHAAFMGLARRHGIEIRYHPMPLMAVFPESGGLPLAKRHPLRQRYRMIELQRWRERRGLSFNLEPRFWPFDQSLADKVVLALVRSGADPELFLPRAFAATWEEERNLADPAEVGDLLRAAGCDADAILVMARTDAIGAAYAAEASTALDDGVFGSPCYRLAGEIFWGQDRLDLLDDALASGRPPFRA